MFNTASLCRLCILQFASLQVHLTTADLKEPTVAQGVKPITLLLLLPVFSKHLPPASYIVALHRPVEYHLKSTAASKRQRQRRLRPWQRRLRQRRLRHRRSWSRRPHCIWPRHPWPGPFLHTHPCHAIVNFKQHFHRRTLKQCRNPIPDHPSTERTPTQTETNSQIRSPRPQTLRTHTRYCRQGPFTRSTAMMMWGMSTLLCP